MQLLGDRLLCVPIVEEKKTSSGLILPMNYESKNEYNVIAVGTKVKHIEVCNRIRTFKHSEGTPAEFNGEMCVVFGEGSDVEYVSD
ncbi:chaperonin [Myroides marinus]|uniref:Chaperonin n=1 Tax=Myroides marinus TaxID=703342 RepID=A0A163YJ67_9FLAO|nr:co-chaperone GroES family protein [Myroides marinus]KUF38945.1 chaperonin [Myroides marinus]KZE79506.1 chaperonin [Myroides marinus]